MSQHTRRTGHPALALAATVFLIPLVSHSGLAVSSPRSGAHQIERTGSRGSKSVSERIISELYQLIHNTPQDEEEFHGKVRKADDNGADFLTPLLAWWHQRAYPGNSIDWSAYSRAAAHVRKMPPAFFGKRGPGMDSGYGLSRGQRRMMSVTASAGSRWEYIGPNKMIPTAQRVYNGVDPLSGRVNGIAFAPSTPGTVYIATMGGVWKSADSGGHWSPLSDGWPTLQAGCVAVDPTKSNVVYAGTGDFDGQGLLGGSSLPNPFQVNAGYPFGLMKSTDGGATWSVQGQKQFGNVIISRIVVDPDNPQDILVATGRGASFWGKVWRSVDGGASWSAVINTPGVWSDVEVGAADTKGQRTYYVTGMVQNFDHVVYTSTDRGVTWTEVHRDTTPTGDPFPDLELTRVAPSPKTPGVAYYTFSGTKAFLKTTDAGANWTDITNKFPDSWDQGIYTLVITASNFQDANGNVKDTLYAGLLDLTATTDDGTDWVSIGQTSTENAVIHADDHAIAVDPNDLNHLFVGTDGGIYDVHVDPVAGTSRVKGLNTTLGTTMHYHSAFSRDDVSINITGLQDNGTKGAMGDLNDWLDFRGGDGGASAMNPRDSMEMYLELPAAIEIDHTTDGWKSLEAILTYSDVQNERVIGGLIYPFPAIGLNPADPSQLYAATDYLRSYSTATKKWTTKIGGAELSAQGVVQAFTVSADGQRIYTGSSQGEVFMSTNGGKSFTEIDGGIQSLPVRAITSLAISPTSTNVLLVGLGGTGADHLWICRNTDAGSSLTWSSASGSGATALPDVSLNAIAIDNVDPNRFYVGTDMGVFSTADQGAHWANASYPIGLPNIQVNDLQVVPEAGYLVASTYGRGIWRIPLPTPVAPLSLTVAPPRGTAGQTLTGTVTLQQPSGVAWQNIALRSSNSQLASVPPSVSVAPGQTQITFSITLGKSDQSTPVTITAQDSAASVTATITVDPVAPNPPYGLTAALWNSSTALLSWSNGGGGTLNFQLQRKAGSGPWANLGGLLPASTTQVIDNTITNGTTYYYQVYAMNSAGPSLPSNVASISTSPVAPGAPQQLKATAVSSSEIDLTWNRPLGDTSSTFTLERKSAGGSFSAISSAITSTSYQDKGLNSGVTYTYRVKANNKVGTSAPSNEASATTTAVPPPPPAAPSGLSASLSNSGSPAATVTLNWSDVDHTVIGYKIERKISSTPYQQLNTDLVTGTTYTDDTILPNVTYTYRVRATNVTGDSPFSNEVSVVNPTDSVSGMVTVQGAGQAGVTLSLQDAAGKGLASTQTDATGAYSFKGLKDGQFTVLASLFSQKQSHSVTLNSAAGLGSATVNFAFQPIFTLPAGISLVSAPFDYSATSFTALDVFGLTGAQGNIPTVAGWNNGISPYPNLPGTQTLPGHGYWALEQKSSAFRALGALVTSPTVDVTLNPGWNLVGDPYTAAISWSALSVKLPFQIGLASPGTPISVTVAAIYKVINPTLFSFIGSSSRNVARAVSRQGGAPFPNPPSLTGSDPLYSPASSLQPFIGYWIYVDPLGSRGQSIQLEFSKPGS